MINFQELWFQIQVIGDIAGAIVLGVTLIISVGIWLYGIFGGEHK